MDKPRYKNLQLSEEELLERAAKWREWLRSIKLAKSYDIEAHENAAKWAIDWGHQSFWYFLGDASVAPGCTEIVLEALQFHGGRPILPVKIDHLEDIAIGLGGGVSGQGEICGAVSGHIIAIGVDVAYRTRETAVIRRDVQAATKKFCKLVRERFGGVRCPIISGVNPLKPDGTPDHDALAKALTPEVLSKCDDCIQLSIYAPLPSEEG